MCLFESLWSPYSQSYLAVISEPSIFQAQEVQACALALPALAHY